MICDLYFVFFCAAFQCITKHSSACRDGAGRFFFFIIFLFFGVNTRTAKTSQCTGTKLGTQIIMVLKPHVQHHINIVVMPSSKGVKRNRGRQFRLYFVDLRTLRTQDLSTIVRHNNR